jgi:hypothetical protein
MLGIKLGVIFRSLSIKKLLIEEFQTSKQEFLNNKSKLDGMNRKIAYKR